MSLLLLLPHTATIRTLTDGSLDAERNWVRDVTTSTSPARLELVTPKETASAGAVIQDRWRVFLPAGTALTAADEVDCDGRRFQVDGTPNRVFGFGAEHHVEAWLLYVADVAQTPEITPGETFGYGEGGYGENYYGGSAA